MAKQKSRKLKQPDELMLFNELHDYVAEVARGETRKGRYYSLCVRASFAKCYEFNLHAWDNTHSESAFFWLPALRGICEDLIVLNYIKAIPHGDRDLLVTDLLMHGIEKNLKTQFAFFSSNRPQQRVLRPALSATQLESLEASIRAIWQHHGWPKMSRGVLPPTRQMAEKHGGEILATLYDYLYRLTSDTVHFSIGGLLRTGWGNKPHVKFSTSNFSGYYTMFGRIYGAFMFCSYFELFARFLRTNDDTKQTVSEIRQLILRTPRWPEMITFEEMNLNPPDIGILQLMFTSLQSMTTNRLLIS